MYLYFVNKHLSSWPPLGLELFPKQVLDSSELKEFADENINCDLNGSMFSKQVENTVGKG